ncbi:class IIb bacteriocin, lactobin A/cerein 7B family [Chitinophaga defluvii]|uniref:Class IIb bacteriocin, lactobin A/cerein 7B family n=1 Tax=Chitinophaga defluvii TaxID=3163343 RepID=A0ABV2TA41_9BACT
MTKLSLEEFGAMEMDQQSMEETNGGILPALAGAAAGIVLLAMYEGGKALGKMLYNELH